MGRRTDSKQLQPHAFPLKISTSPQHGIASAHTSLRATNSYVQSLQTNPRNYFTSEPAFPTLERKQRIQQECENPKTFPCHIVKSTILTTFPLILRNLRNVLVGWRLFCRHSTGVCCGAPLCSRMESIDLPIWAVVVLPYNGAEEVYHRIPTVWRCTWRWKGCRL